MMRTEGNKCIRMCVHLQGTAASLMQNLSFLQPDFQDFSQLPVDDAEDLQEDEQVRSHQSRSRKFRG